MGRNPRKPPKYPPNNLRRLREAKGWTHEQAGEALGMSRSGYMKIERSERKLDQFLLAKAADAHNVTWADILDTPQMAQVIGYVGAGSEAHYYDMGQGPFDEVPMPIGGTSDTVAVEIRGDSLGSGFNGWLAYYDDVQHPPTHDLLKRLCVVGIDDGRILVKWLMRGAQPGLWNLFSQSEGIIENVQVNWAARVISLNPKR